MTSEEHIEYFNFLYLHYVISEIDKPYNNKNSIYKRMTITIGYTCTNMNNCNT